MLAWPGFEERLFGKCSEVQPVRKGKRLMTAGPIKLESSCTSSSSAAPSTPSAAAEATA